MNAIRSPFGLTGNLLKLIAMLTMTIDHIGVILLPQYRILRIIGRLAMPIYAFMIAEGCHYTHDRRAYFLRLFGLAILCLALFFFHGLFYRHVFEYLITMFHVKQIGLSVYETVLLVMKRVLFWLV